MPEEEKTLGRILFGQEIFIGPSYAYLRPIEEANSLQEIKERLFILKLDTPMHMVASVLERIFAGLSNTLDSRDLRIWAQNHLSSRNGFENELISFMEQCRKIIGSMALEVFFDAVFEKDKGALWNYLASPNNCDWWSDYLNRPAATVIKETFGNIKEEIFSYPIYPRALVVYLHYFSVCSGSEKLTHWTQIKRFLKRVLDEPLEPSYEGQKTGVGVSKWSEKARNELARALVVNGLYEECLDYDIHEALEPMTVKFCGGQKELSDGFVHLSEANATLDATQAMEKACKDKEWGHMWSVITRLAFKHGKAEFLCYWPQMQKNYGAVQGKLALVWQYPVLRYSLDPKFIGL